MRLTGAEPHGLYVNLDVRHFACDCGKTYSDQYAKPK